jgi:ribosomal protein S18 acetylase RimI-like enzyme
LATMPRMSAACDHDPVGVQVRPYVAGDAEPLVALSLRAWEPVFKSLESVLGARLFAALRGDWRHGQATDVRATIGANVQTWVAEVDDLLGGFASARLGPAADMGEIVMLAVDPECQRQGVATALTATATTWLRDHDAAVVMVETGGDAGHAAARAAYRSAGFTAVPVTRYFKML